MTFTVIWPKAPVFRRDYCMECFGPVKKAARGRPRNYCSDACRQRRHRDITNFRSREYRFRKEDKAIERVLRKYERAKGKRIDDVTPIIPGTHVDRRHYLIFGMRDGQPMEYCLWCGIPIVRENMGVMGYRRRCCSAACRDQFGKFVRQMKIAVLEYGDGIDPVVIQRLRGFSLKSKRILPPIRTLAGLCDHCHKPFAATHPARKYCSKKCRQNAWYAAHKTCRFCKRRYRPTYKARAQKYCSRHCSARGIGRKPLLSLPRICPECGSPFVTNRRNHTRKVYCSRRCAEKVTLRRQRARKAGKRRMQNSEVRIQK